MAALYPYASGIPPLLNKIAVSAAVMSLMLADSVGVGAAAPPQWGVYDSSGNLVLSPDNVISLDYKQDWMLAQYPIEAGGFESYNKVATPFDVRLLVSKGGTDAERAAFLTTLESITGKTDLYTIVTPDISYTNCNIMHYDYSRQERSGVGLLSVAIWFSEIRQGVTVKFSDVKSPDASPQQSTGNVQPGTSQTLPSGVEAK